MTRRPTWRGRALAAVIVPLVWGCGIEEFPTSMGGGALPGDPLNPRPVEASCDVSATCQCTGGGGGGDVVAPPAECDEVAFGVADLAGRAWRFDSLALSAPLPAGPVADGLNTFFADEIGAGNVNVLLAVDADDRETCALDGRLGAGEAAGAGHRFGGDPAAIALTLTNTGFVTADPSTLDFPVDPDLMDPPFLPLVQVDLAGTLSADAAAVEDGALVAAVTVEDARGIRMMGVTFEQLLGSFGVDPDLDLDGDGANDAWRFVGTFTARTTTLP